MKSFRSLSSRQAGMIFFILLLGFMCSLSTLAQHSIQGKIIDAKSKEAIPGVNIRVNGTWAGTSTDASGNFYIELYENEHELMLSHLSYKNKLIDTRTQKRPLLIELEANEYSVGEVSVRAGSIQSITADKPLFVFDYEFYEDKLMVLANHNRNIFKPWLYLFNYQGDSITSLRLDKGSGLYKDCTDQVHLLSNRLIEQTYFDGQNIRLLYPYPIHMMDSILTPCYEQLSPNYYFHQYLYRNQVLIYYFLNAETSRDGILAIVQDSMKMVQAREEVRFASMGTYSWSDSVFADMIFYKPVYAPLYKIDNQLYIFDLTNGLVRQFNSDGQELEPMKISWHHDKYLRKEIIVDELQAKAYAHFQRNGISTLRSINLKNGELENTYKVPTLAFIEKIRINNGYIFFLYKATVNDSYKRLYKMKL